MKEEFEALITKAAVKAKAEVEAEAETVEMMAGRVEGGGARGREAAATSAPVKASNVSIDKLTLEHANQTHTQRKAQTHTQAHQQAQSHTQAHLQAQQQAQSHTQAQTCVLSAYVLDSMKHGTSNPSSCCCRCCC